MERNTRTSVAAHRTTTLSCKDLNINKEQRKVKNNDALQESKHFCSTENEGDIKLNHVSCYYYLKSTYLDYFPNNFHDQFTIDNVFCTCFLRGRFVQLNA